MSLNSILLLSRLLSSKLSEADKSSLVYTLNREETELKKMLYYADRHLILNSLYPKFNHAGMIEDLPQNLVEHLKMVYEKNIERNLKIQDQVKTINTLLSEKSIKSVFIKGSGLLLDRIYTDPGERIMGDINMLVEDKNFEKAANAFAESGYKPLFAYDSKYRKYLKHYPPLVKEDAPAYVEIHRLAVNRPYSDSLPVSVIFEQRKLSVSIPGCYVMSDNHKIIHNFLHSQLDNKAHLYARNSLRNLYDLYLLSKKTDVEKVFMDFKKKPQKIICLPGYFLFRILIKTGTQKPPYHTPPTEVFT